MSSFRVHITSNAADPVGHFVDNQLVELLADALGELARGGRGPNLRDSPAGANRQYSRL